MSTFDKELFSNIENAAPSVAAGKDILLAVFNETGNQLLAVSGQQGLTINRAAESIDVSSKDTAGGWKAKIAGAKEWSVENEGLYVPNDEAHKLLGSAFENGDLVCVKVINGKTQTGMFGGLAVVSEYSLEAPFDEGMTYSISLEGNGALIDLTDLESEETIPKEEPEE